MVILSNNVYLLVAALAFTLSKRVFGSHYVRHAQRDCETVRRSCYCESPRAEVLVSQPVSRGPQSVSDLNKVAV